MNKNDATRKRRNFFKLLTNQVFCEDSTSTRFFFFSFFIFKLPKLKLCYHIVAVILNDIKPFHNLCYAFKTKDGPRDKTEIVKVPVNIRTNEVEIRPLAWSGIIPCLRLELYGCPGILSINILEIEHL